MGLIPLFEYQDDMRKFRSGETAKVRSVVQVLVKDKDSDEYCWIRHTHDGDISAFFGGVDEGELPIDAAIREVAEEGGFTKIVGHKLGLYYHCRFYHPTKCRNQYSLCQTVFLEIDRKEKKVVSHYELAKHETIWMTLESFEKESKNDTTLYLVRELLNIKQKQWKLYHEEDLLADL